jgi:hypothetical protein
MDPPNSVEAAKSPAAKVTAREANAKE